MFCRNGLLPENLGQILKDLSPSIEIDENGIGMLKPDSSAEDAVPIGDKVMLWRWRCTFGLSPMDSMSRYHNARNSLSAWNPDALHELEWLMNHVSTTGSENWSLLADICERASIDEASSKTAVQFLTRIFQNAEPFTQLNAAHLWGTMLQNSRPVFLQQNMSMEFVTVLEKVITSVRTSRMVGHRLLEVLGAASWCSEPDNSIRNLWGRIKPKGAPDIGIPIRTFNSRYGLPSLYPSSPEVLSKIEENRPRASLPLSLLYSHGLTEQGLRQLFNECAVARDNSASLLKAAGLVQKGDEEELQAIQQLYTKCYSSVGYLDQQVRNLKIWAEVYRGTSEPDTLEQQLLETLSSVGNDLDRALVESIRAQKRLGVSWDTAT
ncbi:hypothetical protein OBBRIDRAFT_85582 [Obba rivulosa]|uniref:VHS domain-containing protein n=1 Tax=Obba rivulosa TaxID=1052685 RepID=A0A8E2ASI3_9APHY|nr:hypothetical protein OBBRIDRAFT_85582 [Obba rivulosa]